MKTKGVIYSDKRKVWLKDYMHERLVIDGQGHERDIPIPAETVISKPPHQLGFTTFSQIIDNAQELAENRIEQSLWRDEINIDIKTPYKWFAIQPWGDFHMGSHGCDYEKLKELLAGPLQHDNLKTILLGNLGDFFTPMGGPKDGSIGDVLPLQQQLFAVKKFLTEYQDVILAEVNAPDHEDWIYRSSGIDIYEFLTEQLDIPLVTAGGSVKINFGEVSYDIMPFHKIAKFKSAFNLTHGHKRALELNRDADIVLAGHVHKPDYETSWRNGHEVALIQIGTLETEETGSMYGKKEGFLGPVQSIFPVLLLNTQEKDMQIVTSVEHSLPYLSIK
jgi:hypothetical protein